jgi:hypothetical protein
MAKTNEALALVPNYTDLLATDDSVAAKRYQRFKKGETIEQIAKADGVKIETIRLAILAFDKKFALLTQNAIVRERLDGELSNEKLRAAIRSRVHNKVLKAIDTLVTGERKYVSFDQTKGKFVTVKAVDFNMMLQGIKEFQKLVSLEQKPSVPHTVVNVNQQTNVNPAHGEDFEERMRRIKKKQKESIEASEAEKVIDVEPIEEEEVDEGPEWDF